MLSVLYLLIILLIILVSADRFEKYIDKQEKVKLQAINVISIEYYKDKQRVS